MSQTPKKNGSNPPNSVSWAEYSRIIEDNSRLAAENEVLKKELKEIQIPPPSFQQEFPESDQQGSMDVDSSSRF